MLTSVSVDEIFLPRLLIYLRPFARFRIGLQNWHVSCHNPRKCCNITSNNGSEGDNSKEFMMALLVVILVPDTGQ